MLDFIKILIGYLKPCFIFIFFKFENLPSPAEAKSLGLVNEVYSSVDNMMEEVQKIAQTIASKSPLVTRVIKKQINYARDNSVRDSLEYHAMWNASLISHKDTETALTAFMNKSEGEFDDLEELKSFWEKEGLI